MNRSYSLKRKGFSYAYNKGKFVSDEFVSLIYAVNKDKKLRAGFPVGKKFGKAVKRNRLKRRLKACFFSFFSRLDQGHSFIVMPKDGTADCDFAALQKSMERVLRKAGVLR